MKPDLDACAPTPGDELARPLGALEHLFWLLDRRHPMHFAIAARVGGVTSLAAWRQALDALQQVHSRLRVEIATTPDGAPRFRPSVDPIPLRIATEPAARLETELARELHAPFDPARGPLVRATVLHAPAAATVVLAAHHSVADGLSLAYLVRDLVRLLGGGAPVASPEQAAHGAADAAEATEREPPDLLRPAVYRKHGETPPRIDAVRFSAAFTERLSARARREGTTVNAALCAAVAVAGAQISPAWRAATVRLNAPIDVRRLRAAGERCGLFIGLGTAALDATRGVWNLARETRRSLRTMHDDGGVAATDRLLEEIVASGPDVDAAAGLLSSLFPYELHLTNLGRLPYSENAGAVRLLSVYGPTVLLGLQGEQNVGATTLDGSLTLTHASYDPISGLLAGSERVLAAACAE